MKSYIELLMCLLLASPIVAAETAGQQQRITVKAIRLTEPVHMDGIISESFWRDELAISDFVQSEPKEGEPATERTVVDVAYDDSAIYVAARMYDSNPKDIIARLARKDVEVKSDRFVFYVDSYHDRRTGFYFGVNAAGTLYDGTLNNDSWTDNSWDGVWEGKAHVDGTGWSVEMRIPYSQLRFESDPRLVWGVNFEREIARKNELDYVVYTPKNGQGFVSRFADLTGLENLSPPRRIEIIPYATSQFSLTNPDAGDPFHDGSSFSPGYGADMRLGIGSNLTVNATVNPDFGQVEVDPAVVNLSDVETFFPEKRPFFIEGSSIFEFGFGGASSFWGFNWGNPDFFYSRRIGRAPQGSVPDSDYSDSPAGVQILTAAKLTGKLAGHWNIGSLLAITDREFAGVSSGNEITSAELEPLTYYAVSRIQREFGEGNSALGIVSTLVHREFQGERLRSEINGDALTLGVDGWRFLGTDKEWALGGWAGYSNIRGTAERIADLQQESRHYFQRPDATDVEFDPTATSLSGASGRMYLNREKGNILFNSALGFISPGFDVNDVGFLWRANMINGHIASGYRWTQPGKFYQSARINLAHFRTTDFSGETTWVGYYTSGFLQFPNYYEGSFMLAYNPESMSITLTRGGPKVVNPNGFEWDLYVNTDSRSRVVLGAGLHGQSYAQGAGTYRSYYGSIEWKPSSRLSLEFSPNYEFNYTNAQYIDTFSDEYATTTYGNRYVFGELDQRTASAGIRLNWTFTPGLSLQIYGQPLISAGSYSRFGELARPRSYDFDRYGNRISLQDGVYTVDPDSGGPAESFQFDDPNFNFRSLRGNAILRWEFRPGSSLYFVWTQDRTDEEAMGDLKFGHSLSRLLSSQADNIFLVKFSYYWNP